MATRRKQRSSRKRRKQRQMRKQEGGLNMTDPNDPAPVRLHQAIIIVNGGGLRALFRTAPSSVVRR